MRTPQFKKYSKAKKLKSKGLEYRNTNLEFGFFGLKALSNGRLNLKNIETARQSISRHIRPFGKLWIRIFDYVPISSSPAKVRMGKGKGSFSYWGSKVKKGQIIFEVSGITREQALLALRIGGSKLPMKTKVVKY
jgi:large subunit ribosomal protein L16